MFFPNYGIVKYPIPDNGVLFSTAGTYSWTAPIGVTEVNVACIGGGGTGYQDGGGGGGGLGWKNNIPVIPGQSYTVFVGQGGSWNGANILASVVSGQSSWFISPSLVGGDGGMYNGGGFTGDGGFNGGDGGADGYVTFNGWAGGGSAGKFNGNGADGTDKYPGYYGPHGSGTYLKGVGGPPAVNEAPRFGAGTSGGGARTGASGGVWIDWKPNTSFPTRGL